MSARVPDRGEVRKVSRVDPRRDEVEVGPKPDSNEYSSVPFGAQKEPSLAFPIIMIVCIFLMGLLVWMMASDRLSKLERRLQKIEKLIKVDSKEKPE